MVFTLVLAAIISAFFSPMSARAQVGISLYPVKFDISVEPGKPYADAITVINPNDFPIADQPEVENISAGDEGAIDLVDTDIPHGLTAWISMDRMPFTLAPQERREVPFTITVPTGGGEPGSHYGVILFRGIPVAGTPSNGIGISGRVGSVVLATVPGDAVKTGLIESFTGPGSFLARGPVDFTFKVKNTGNSHFEPQGKITLSGPLVKTTDLSFEPRIVFPGHNRTFKAKWDTRYGFGPITATLNIMVPDSGSQNATLTFFMFPWQEALGFLALVFIIGFFWRMFRKNFRIVKISSPK